MSFTDVMYGGLGQVNNMFQGNLAGNAAAMQGQAANNANLAAIAAQNQAALNNAYGPAGFGGVTAANAAAGAAALGSIGPAQAPGTYSPGSGLSSFSGVPMGSVFDTGTTPFNDYNGGANPGGFSPSPNYPGGSNTGDPGGNIWNTGTTGIQPGGGLGTPGFGIGQSNYTGQPGYGLQVGSVGQPTYSVAPQYGYSGDGLPTYPGSDVMGGAAFESPFGGAATGRGVSGWEAAYLAANPDVAKAAWSSNQDLNAFADQHFKNFGQNENRDIFNADLYRIQNPDVAAAGVDPLQHYLQYGRAEGRAEPITAAHSTSRCTCSKTPTWQRQA